MRSSQIAVGLLLAMLAFIAPAGTADAPSKPNIILILADDLGYGDVGPFGSKLNRTPALDRLAAEGMRLTSFYACPVCTPSRAQFMTGCYAKRVSMPAVIFPSCPTGINPGEATLPKLLKQQGYATMCIGKWHLGDQRQFLPPQYGFDHYFGLPYSNDMGGGEEWPQPRPGARVSGIVGLGAELGITRGRRPPLPLVRDVEVIETVSPAQQDRLTERYTDEAIKFISEHQSQPFFLYMPHTAVHIPLHPGEKFRGKSANGTYGDWVEEMDWSIGRVMATLRELKLDQNTLVIFTSDNGPWLTQGKNGGVAGPLRGGKGSTWEGGVREPTVAWFPGKIKAGSASDAVTANIDLLPTFVKLSGGAVPTDRKIDGADIWPILNGTANESTREAHYYFNGARLEAVRSGPWKLSIRPQVLATPGEKPIPAGAEKTHTPRLYNLVDDIGETADVSARNPQVVARLQGLVSKMDADLGIASAGPGVRPPGRVAKPVPLLLPGVDYVVETPSTQPATGKAIGELRIGDVLGKELAPPVAGKPLTITADVTPRKPDGIILAHGGTTNGYALHLRDGKLVFTVRQNKQVVAITASDTPAGRMAIEARLASDGSMTLSINGKAVAQDKAAGLLPAQPAENFCLGFDDGAAVGSYANEDLFSGTIENLKVVVGMR